MSVVALHVWSCGDWQLFVYVQNKWPNWWTTFSWSLFSPWLHKRIENVSCKHSHPNLKLLKRVVTKVCTLLLLNYNTNFRQSGRFFNIFIWWWNLSLHYFISSILQRSSSRISYLHVAWKCLQGSACVFLLWPLSVIPGKRIWTSCRRKCSLYVIPLKPP